MCAVADWYCFIYFFCLPPTRFDSLIAVVSRALFMDLYNQSKNITVFVTKLCTAELVTSGLHFAAAEYSWELTESAEAMLSFNDCLLFAGLASESYT